MAPSFISRALWLWIVLGVLGISYMALCPHAYHTPLWDFLAGLLAGLGIVACFVRVQKAA